MDSAPTASPISIWPERIWFEMTVVAMRPLEQKRLITWTGTDSGKPAASAADLA